MTIFVISVTSHALDPLPLSQTVTLSPTPSPSTVTYFMDGPQRLHSSRCCAFSLHFQYPSSIIQPMSFCLCLSLFFSILPSIISHCRELPLRMCPIQFFCLVLIISIKDLFLPPFSVLLHSFCVLSS